MSYTTVGSCPHCGAPIVSPSVWMGVTPAPSIHTCNVPNVPLQRWVNLIVSVYGRSLDVYIDGKLVRTCVLENTAFVDPKAGVYVTPDGGFAGWTSNFQYFNDAVNPQQAWNIYKNGYGGSLLGDLFNKYVTCIPWMLYFFVIFDVRFCFFSGHFGRLSARY